jgi:hypothetical protein
MQTQIVARLLEKHPDSLPLLLLRGHAMLISGKGGGALPHYFAVRFPLLSSTPFSAAIAN